MPVVRALVDLLIFNRQLRSKIMDNQKVLCEDLVASLLIKLS